MTKTELKKQALIIRNEAIKQAEIDFQDSVSKLNLPHFKMDFSDAMFIESKRQDLLIAPLREKYLNARHEAFRIYTESCNGVIVK